MKKNIHPTNYRPVLFFDTSVKQGWVVRSCADCSGTMIFAEDGKEYPVFFLETSAKSHPFYTNTIKDVADKGRAKKYMDKYKKFNIK